MSRYENVPITSPKHFHLFHGMAGYLPDQNDFYWHKKYALDRLRSVKDDWLEFDAQAQSINPQTLAVKIKGKIVDGFIEIERPTPLVSFIAHIEECDDIEHVKYEIESDPSKYPLSSA